MGGSGASCAACCVREQPAHKKIQPRNRTEIEVVPQGVLKGILVNALKRYGLLRISASSFFSAMDFPRCVLPV